MQLGSIWRPGECLPEGSRTANLKVIGDYLPPQRTNTPISSYGDVDPDYESGEKIISRIHDKDKLVPLININCECLIQHKLTKKQKNLYSSEHFSDSDSEDEDTNVTMLIKMLNGLTNRLSSRTSYKALNSVLDSYNCKENINDDQLSGMWDFLKHSNTAIVEIVLKFFTKLCVIQSNAELLLNRQILDYVFTIISSSQSVLMAPILQLIQIIISHEELTEKWSEPVTYNFLPLFITYLYDDSMTLDCKYSICCVFCELVKSPQFLEITQTQIIPAVSFVKDCSGKLREVFTEILTGLLLHTDVLPPDVVDSGIVPSTVSMIRDGPCGTQVQALKLLSGLTESESSVPAVLDNTYAVPYILCCIKESKCRKAKREALKTLCHLTRSRRLGMCKEFMVQAASYLIPTDTLHLMGSSVGNRVMSPSRNRHIEKDSDLWKGLHRLIKTIGKLIIKESLSEVDKSGKVISVGYKPCIDMCHVRVLSLNNCIRVLQNVCLWPTGKNKQDVSSLDLKNFTDSGEQRLRLSKLNRSLAQRVWDTSGATVVPLLGAFSDKLVSVQQMAQQYKTEKDVPCTQHTEKESKYRVSQDAIDKMVDKKGLVDLSVIIEKEELDLVKSMLEFVLCISLCSCKDFPDLMPKKQKSPHHISKQGRASRSDTLLGRPPLPKKLTRPSSAHQHRPSSPSKEGRQLWNKDNPHLTNTLERSSTSVENDLNHYHAELIKKETATERRLLRKCLYEADVIRIIGSFLLCSQTDLQILACQILRCCVQPLEEKIYPESHLSQPVKQRIRPQSAVGSKEADHQMKIAFHYMSPEIASLIREALGPDVTEVTRSEDITEVKEAEIADKEAVDRLNLYMQSKEPLPVKTQLSNIPKPVINLSKPIAGQCRECLLNHGGTSVIGGIFAKSKEVRKSSVLLLQDVVHFGNTENHMALSKYGCMPRLLDFIRINKDDELLEIIGLIIIQMLVSSDERIKQVFNRYGGTRLLTSMAGFTKGLLREEVAKTLHTVSRSKGPVKKLVRPSSAPVSRMRTPCHTDVWDDIQSRWKVEDKVYALLKSWKK